jgi:hypothetical protein
MMPGYVLLSLKWMRHSYGDLSHGRTSLDCLEGPISNLRETSFCHFVLDPAAISLFRIQAGKSGYQEAADVPLPFVAAGLAPIMSRGRTAIRSYLSGWNSTTHRGLEKANGTRKAGNTGHLNLVPDWRI